MTRQEMITYRPKFKAHLIEIQMPADAIQEIMAAFDRKMEETEPLKCVKCEATTQDVDKSYCGVAMCYKCRKDEMYFDCEYN